MSLSPDEFDVTVFDKEGEAGGMATSVSQVHNAASLDVQAEYIRFLSMRASTEPDTSMMESRVAPLNCESGGRAGLKLETTADDKSYNTIKMFEILGFK